MKTYLLETYNSDINFDENSQIIALTPEVCYELDKIGTKYSIIEDYYDEQELHSKADELLNFQYIWINKFDEFLQSIIPDLKKFRLKMGTIYFYFIKTMLDPIIFTSITMKIMFEKIQPSSLIYITRHSKQVPLDFKLFHEGVSLYAQICRIVCNERRIPFEFIYTRVKEPKQEDSIIHSRNLRIDLERALAKIKFIRMMNFFLRFGKDYYFNKRAKKKLNIILLKLDYNGFEIAKTGLRNGHNVYLLSDNQIMKYTAFGLKLDTTLEIKNKENLLYNKDITWKKAVTLLEKHPLIGEINAKCQLNVSKIVLPKLKYFILDVCPEILEYFKVFIKYYNTKKMDFVIAPYRWKPIEFSAIAAANSLKTPKTVGILHGNDIFINLFWYTIDMIHSKIYICTDEEYRKYFKQLCKINNYPTRVYKSSHRLLNIIKIKRLRAKKKNDQIKKREKIIYLPTNTVGDTHRITGAQYADTWYYKFQKSIIEYLSTKKEYTFVWKGLPAADHIYNPIPNFINDCKFSNIEIATNPFAEHLLTTGRVICDYPSTGFYESVIAGVPTMSLYYKTFKVRPTAINYFGNMVKAYSNTQEAIEHIENFLNSDPKLYIKNIEMNDRNVIEILEEIKNEKS